MLIGILQKTFSVFRAAKGSVNILYQFGFVFMEGGPVV